MLVSLYTVTVSYTHLDVYKRQVLLEVYTVNGIYYVFYNANDRGDIRQAYYISGVFARCV